MHSPGQCIGCAILSAPGCPHNPQISLPPSPAPREANDQSSNGCLPDTYSGCRGLPSLVMPRQSNLASAKLYMARSTIFRGARAPHATTTRPSRADARCKKSSLSGPHGSGCIRQSIGLVARYAMRLTTMIPPYPSRTAKAIQRRIVGSSCDASAVDGLSMHQTIILSGLHRLTRVYRYRPSSLMTASVVMVSPPMPRGRYGRSPR